MNFIKSKYVCLLLDIFIIITFIFYSDLLSNDSPAETVEKYYYALQTHQDQLIFRQLEEFDWSSTSSISRKPIYRVYAPFFDISGKHGLIKNFEIINVSVSDNYAEIDVKIKWADGNGIVDKVKLSNKTGRWKIVSAGVYY